MRPGRASPSRSARRSVLVAAVLLAGAVAAQDRVQTIRGRVVDADGRGVAGVPVALKWSFRDPPVPEWSVRVDGRPRPHRVVTDAEGWFDGPIDLAFAPQPMYALDRDGRRGAVGVVTRENVDAPLTLELRDLVRLHGTFADNEPNAPLTSSYIHVGLPGVRLGVASDLSTSPSFSVELPSGATR